MSKPLRLRVFALKKLRQAGRPRYLSFASQAIQREVQRHHVHAWLAEQAEVTATRVLLNEFAQFFFGNSARLGDARDLDFRVRRRNVRVKAAGGFRHGVGGNHIINRRVRCDIVIRAVGSDVRGDVGDEIRRSWTKIAAAGTRGVKTVRARRRRARMKVLRAGEILREQRRAANRAGFVHEQTAAGLVRKQ